MSLCAEAGGEGCGQEAAPAGLKAGSRAPPAARRRSPRPYLLFRLAASGLPGPGLRGPEARPPGRRREPVGRSRRPPAPKQTFPRPSPPRAPSSRSAWPPGLAHAQCGPGPGAEQEERAAGRAAGPVNWQLRGEGWWLVSVSGGESVCAPPAPAPIRAAGKMGGARHCGRMGGGGGLVLL